MVQLSSASSSMCVFDLSFFFSLLFSLVHEELMNSKPLAWPARGT